MVDAIELEALIKERDEWKSKAGYEDHDGRFHLFFDELKSRNSDWTAAFEAYKKEKAKVEKLREALGRITENPSNSPFNLRTAEEMAEIAAGALRENDGE